ncbi:hypothetical protein BGZ92_003555 [Podila epicladia]|nr:hypothetical protein BGZ92_003555 [Podila epicladia]
MSSQDENDYVDAAAEFADDTDYNDALVNNYQETGLFAYFSKLNSALKEFEIRDMNFPICKERQQRG